jgi:hypothetical protein
MAMSEFFTWGHQGINLAEIVAWQDDPTKQMLRVIFTAQTARLFDLMLEGGLLTRTFSMSEGGLVSGTVSGELRQRLLARLGEG